jgi:flagella basal body P-ring formation protein FlgA
MLMLPVHILAAVAAATGCVSVTGEHILAGELAGVHPVFQSLAPDTRVGITPNPGATRLISPAELRRLASRNGHAVDSSFPAEPVCVVYKTGQIDPAAIEAALRNEIPASRGTIELSDYSRWPVPTGEIEFPSAGSGAPRPDRSDGTLLYRGFVRYAGSRTFPIWARVHLRIERQAVVALEELKAGQPVGASQVGVATRTEAFFADTILEDPAMAVGTLPRKTIARGSMIDSRFLAQPRLVEAGGTLQVEVQIGQARLSLETRAESGGRLGDRISARNPNSGKRFVATVSGPGKATVEMDEVQKW